MVDLSYYDLGLDGNWYALISDYEGMREQVYSVLDKHEIEPLYVETMLEPLIEKSPVLIQLKDADDPITEKLPDSHSLYFFAESTVSFEQVIDHLRLRMNILFDGNRKGLFHFYHPAVASYFFGLSEPKDTSQWLAPLLAVLVYRQIHSCADDWVLISPSDNRPDAELQRGVWSIAYSQHNALIQQMDEKDIVEWMKENGHSEINWTHQLKVKTFTEQVGLSHLSLIVSLRNFVHKEKADIDKFIFDQKQLSSLDQFDKLKQIKETMVRELIHVR
ncbi:DUF4123 domain-containing protein [Vibrio salinus]|uniref:DUF4123 domain-containing protein n=1 Tax=Vibrio salinus TaxID=2899784 RepID=UPI001E445129|nr:DUF4123 domain-containing protein [Vibrio salinus]MCE0495148.1 DUF4123 domain-containing protein [Vibrio salinus]